MIIKEQIDAIGDDGKALELRDKIHELRTIAMALLGERDRLCIVIGMIDAECNNTLLVSNDWGAVVPVRRIKAHIKALG